MASAGDDDGIAAAVQQREPPASVPLCTEDVHVREPGLWVGLSKDALSSDQALAAVASPAAGATSMFVGWSWGSRGCALLECCARAGQRSWSSDCRGVWCRC